MKHYQNRVTVMKRIIFLRFIVLSASIILIAAGLAQRGNLDMMNKAVRICFECIGIG